MDIFQPWWIEGNYQHVFILGIFNHLIETAWATEKIKYLIPWNTGWFRQGFPFNGQFHYGTWNDHWSPTPGWLHSRSTTRFLSPRWQWLQGPSKSHPTGPEVSIPFGEPLQSRTTEQPYNFQDFCSSPWFYDLHFLRQVFLVVIQGFAKLTKSPWSHNPPDLPNHAKPTRPDFSMRLARAPPGAKLLEVQVKHGLQLVGGFNPFEKYAQIGNLPQIGLNIRNVWNHQADGGCVKSTTCFAASCIQAFLIFRILEVE